MQIQRWQSVMLFFAFILMVVYLCTPLGYLPESVTMYPVDFMGLFILNIVIAVLLFIDIFLYRNLKVQMTWTLIVMLLQAVSAGLTFSIDYFTDNFTMSIFGAPFVVAALVLTWFARRFMDRDRKLLASADRLR